MGNGLRDGSRVADPELIAAARSGDRSAFEQLVRLTYAGTYALAWRLTANEEDARDVVQDAYLRAWKGIDGFRGDAELTTWLYRITANCASSHISRRRRHRTEPLGEGHDHADPTLASDPALAVDVSAGLGRLGRAVEALPAKLRAAVVLHDVYDLPHQAIAEELGISVTAAKVRLHRGRRLLREMLEVVDDRGVRAG